MQDIYIIGAGGFAKEVALLINQINKAKKKYNIKGFIDQLPNDNRYKICSDLLPIYSEEFFFENHNHDSDNIQLAIGIGNPGTIQKIASKFQRFEFPNLIHPNCIGDFENIKLAMGNIITANNIFTTNISIGSYNIFNLNCTLGHDSQIGDFNVFNPGTNISGCVKIASGNLFGTNSTILQTIEVGNHNLIGACSLVNKIVYDHALMVGIPAKKIKENNYD